MLRLNVADGIHALMHANVNAYIIEDDDGITLVDAGLPRMWPMLHIALETLGRRPEEIKALVLTHGHFDHVGYAARVQREWNVPVYVHQADVGLAAHPYRYKPQRNRFVYPFMHPRSLPTIARMATAGALRVKGVTNTRPYETNTPLPVPGEPTPQHTPGHTRGHCILQLADRDTMITGDALVTFDPYTGKAGPQTVASAATQDTREAIRSLDVIGKSSAQTLLPGHGEPWTQGAQAAVRHAIAIGQH